MRKIALFLLLFPLFVGAQDDGDGVDKFVDEASGLVVAMPEGWDRDPRREQGAIKFAARLDVGRGGKAVGFEIEAGPASGFDATSWLAREERTFTKHIKDPTIAFKKESRMVGGHNGHAFVMEGTVTPEGGEPYTLRVRGCAVINGAIFFRILEMSYRDAHKGAEADLKAMWDAITFQAADPTAGDGGGGLGEGDSGDGVLEDTVLEDTAGNYKLTVPKGWTIARPPPESEDDYVRIELVRTNEDGRALLALVVFQDRSLRAETFSLDSPGDVLEDQIKRRRLMDPIYGDGASQILRPDVREGEGLGGAEKSASYMIESHTLDEEKKIREAENLKRRGEKIEVPNPPKTVVRGRIALISPHIWIIRAQFAKGVAEDPQLLAEYEKIVKSWEFLVAEALPAPLARLGTLFKDTVTEFKEDRTKL